MLLSVFWFQMFAGTCLKGANAVYFGNTLDFLYEFVPMVVFAVSLFVYMVFCKYLPLLCVCRGNDGDCDAEPTL
jgi:V-type ATPase 116kDa subunit family